jgi:hypothetical protein
MEQQEAPQNMFAASTQMAAEEQQAEPQIDHSELTNYVGQLQAELDQKIEQIKSDRRLDKSEQRLQISETWNRATEAHANLMTWYQGQLEERSAEQERRVFHIGTQQMQDSARSTYADLYHHTNLLLSSGESEGITAAEEEMERLWERAARTGDKVLQLVVGHRAAEVGMEKLRDRWLQTSEEKTRAWQKYVEARQKLEHFKNPQERLWGQLTGGFALRKPPEA